MLFIAYNFSFLYRSLIIALSCNEKFGNFLELVPSSDLKSTNEDAKHECSTDAKEIRREADVLREVNAQTIPRVLSCKCSLGFQRSIAERSLSFVC